MINKKGQNWSFSQVIGILMIIIVVALVVTGVIPTFGQNAASSTSCASKNGYCYTGQTCPNGELRWNFDPARECEKKNEICCMKNAATNTGEVKSTECTGKTTGQKCSTATGESYVCDENSQCITKCEYCGAHPTDTTNCKVNIKNFEFNSRYVCGCTQAECTVKSKTTPPTCLSGVGGFCYNGAFCCEI